MTSDAKVGLLLGLVFIFIIAFVINGLPTFNAEKNNNALTDNMLSSQNNQLGLADEQRKATREIISPIKPVVKQPVVQVVSPPAVQDDIRYKAPLPQPVLPVPQTKEAEKVTNVTAQPASNTEALSKFYVVSEGDCLAEIAQKFYGPEEGNRRINITRIYQANRKYLESPDNISIGQKLIIPLLSGSGGDKGETEKLLSSGSFTEVESIGQRHILKKEPGTSKVRVYIVQEDDNLWRIAAKQLGNGNRYNEIAKLNAGILDDQDCLAIGMHLKIPAK